MEKFVLPYKDKLYRFALRIVGNEFDAEDIMQELAIKIWQRRDKFRELENKEAWCMTVTRNMAIDKVRNSKKRRYIDISEAYDLSDGDRNPYEKVVADDSMNQLNEWMAKLPENQKITLHLREIEGMSYKEISTICSMSLEQVKSNIFRARQTLKSILEKKYRGKRTLA